MRRPLLVTLLLLVSSLAPIGVIPTASADDQGTPHGPGEWTVGMEWAWERSDGTEIRTSVHERKELQTPYGAWDVFMTKSREERSDGTLIVRTTAFLVGSHRRAYDEAHIHQPGQPTMTVHTQYNPPAPHPFWEAMDPGDAERETVKTVTRTTIMEGGRPQPYTKSNSTWEYTVWTDDETTEITTPAGTFETYGTYVHREAKDENRTQRFNYYHSWEARQFVATHSDGERDLELTEIILDPPPRAHASITPRLPTAGEQVLLDASHSYDPNGEVKAIEWLLPGGTTLTGAKVNHTFHQPGSYELTLRVTDDHDQTTESPVLVEVVDPHPGVQLVGPNATEVGEPTPFRLVTDENRTITRATWNAAGIEARSGDEVDLVFPRSGGYTVNVTFVDNEGNTGSLTHRIHVIGDSGRDASSTSAQVDHDRPGIEHPQDGSSVDASDVLVIVRTNGLREPVLMLHNGLRVPLTPQQGLATTHVPVPEGGATIVLQDGAHVIDRVEVHRGPSTDAQDNDTDAPNATGELGTDTDQGTNSTPLPLLAPLLILLPLLRRRHR